MTPFGREIKRLREGKGLSQAALAKSAGLTQGAVGHLETGRTKTVGADVLYKLADALGVTCDHFRPFLGAEDVPTSPPPLVGRPAKQPALPKKKGKSAR